MTVEKFQDDLVEEIKELLSNRLYQKAYSEERVQINVFPQSIPLEIQMENENEDEDPELQKAPFIIVKLMDGATGDYQSADEANIYLNICIYDDDFKKQGHRQLLEIYEVIKKRFMVDQVVGKYYRLDEEKGIKWAMQDEETYPFYFAGMSMTFELPAVRKEDKFC